MYLHEYNYYNPCKRGVRNRIDLGQVCKGNHYFHKRETIPAPYVIKTCNKETNQVYNSRLFLSIYRLLGWHCRQESLVWGTTLANINVWLNSVELVVTM